MHSQTATANARNHLFLASSTWDVGHLALLLCFVLFCLFPKLTTYLSFKSLSKIAFGWFKKKKTFVANTALLVSCLWFRELVSAHLFVWIHILVLPTPSQKVGRRHDRNVSGGLWQTVALLAWWTAKRKENCYFPSICALLCISPGLVFLVASVWVFPSSGSPCPLPIRIPVHCGWKSFPLSCWILSRGVAGLFGTIWVVYLFQIKAPAFCLGLRVRVPRVLWNWTPLNTPGDSSELAHRFPGWQMHKAKGKGEVFISSLGPTIPLKSLWLAPSRIIPTAAGNPQAVFSPDKHPGQRKDLNILLEKERPLR